MALYANIQTVTYFDSFGFEYVPKEIIKSIDNKKIITNISRIQAYDSIMCCYFCIVFINFIFNGKSVTDFTNLFSPNDLKKNDDITLKYVKMSNSNVELDDLTKFRLDEISKIKDYVNAEIKERKDIVKTISKYIVAFDYVDKFLITLSPLFGTLSIVSHAAVLGIPVGIAGASLTVIFTVTTGVIEKLLNITRKKKKKHNKIITLARNKLNIIETLISRALNDFDINHEEFSKIIYEKNNYEQMKDNIRNAKSINDLNKENDRITS